MQEIGSSTLKSLIKSITVYLKDNEGPKNCGCAVLSEFSLEEYVIVGNVQCKKLDPPSNLSLRPLLRKMLK